MSRGSAMLHDESSMGLAPVLVQGIFSGLREINQARTTILLVEQGGNCSDYSHAALSCNHSLRASER